jgi:hypothetical protein
MSLHGIGDGEHTMHGHEPGRPSVPEALVLRGLGLTCLNSRDAVPLPPIAFLRQNRPEVTAA